MTYRQWHYRNVYLRSQHWFRLRAAVMTRDGGKCVECGSEDKVTAHHTVYRESPYQSVPQDLVTLCFACHEKVHEIRRVNGEVVSIKQMPQYLKPRPATKPAFVNRAGTGRKARRKRRNKWLTKARRLGWSF